MWSPTKLVLAGGITLFLVQNSFFAAGQQGPAPEKIASSSPSPTSPKKATGINSTVDVTAPVITVHGLCEPSAQNNSTAAGSCDKVISRQEFELLMEALNPEGQSIPPLAKRNLAKNYADFLAVEAAAKKASIEDTPEFRELMMWARLRTVTDLYRRNLQEKYQNPSQEEIDAYYKQHLADFERVHLARILVTREGASAPDKDAFDKKALETARAARERAVKGDDPVQIQKDAYAALGLNVPPQTDLGKRRRADLIPSEAAEVFALQPGGVTQVQTEAKNYVIYKVLAKDAVPEEEAKKDITREIYEQKFKAAMKSVLDSAPAELNKEYFDSGTTSPAASRPTER